MTTVERFNAAMDIRDAKTLLASTCREWEMVLLALCMVFSSLGGLTLANQLRWSKRAEASGLPLATALAFGPLILGLSVVISLGVFPNVSPRWQLITSLAMVVAASLPSLYAKRLFKVAIVPSYLGVLTASFLALLSFGTVALFALLTPWFANDALEYAIVARELMHNNDLLTYPIVSPEASVSGFYGPMTHPPLYPALLYLFNTGGDREVIDWVAKIPTLWFAIAACALTYTLARMHSEIAGVAALLLLLGVPLLRDSIGTGLIDVLPLAGLLLLCAVQVGSLEGARRRGLVSGLALGMTLWTHSQAVLFIPVLVALVSINYGAERLRPALLEVSVSGAAAFVIALFPYARNFVVFGSPVSDNPAVFQMPGLKWGEYFAQARGISSGVSELQYGLFKGWFAYASYGFVFWLALPGMLLIAGTLLSRFSRIIREGSSGSGCQLEVGLGTILAVYYSGVIASLFLGIDLMIKNDRYLLAWLGPVVVAGGMGISFLLAGAYRTTIDTSASLIRREGHVAGVVLSLVLFTLVPLWPDPIGWSGFNLSSCSALGLLPGQMTVLLRLLAQAR